MDSEHSKRDENEQLSIDCLNRDNDIITATNIEDINATTNLSTNFTTNLTNEEITMHTEIEHTNTIGLETVSTISYMGCEKNLLENMECDENKKSRNTNLMKENMESVTNKESDKQQRPSSTETYSTINTDETVTNEDINPEDSNETVEKKNQYLDKQTSVYDQPVVKNNVDINFKQTMDQECVTEAIVDSNFRTYSENSDKKLELGGIVEAKSGNEYETSPSNIVTKNKQMETDDRNIETVIPEPTTKSLIVKDLEEIAEESDTQLSNNEEEKFQLVWEDDDDDNENIGETTETDKFSDLQDNLLETENSDATQKDLKCKTLGITTTPNTSFLPSREHGLNKPDVMLEIPTQDLGEFSDDNDDYGQEQSENLNILPDIDTCQTDEYDKSDNHISISAEDIKVMAVEVGFTTPASIDSINKQSETSFGLDQSQANNLNKEYDLVTTFADNNKSPSPIMQMEKCNNDQNSSLITLIDKSENISVDVEKMAVDQDISECSHVDSAEEKNQKEEIDPQPSTSALSCNNSLNEIPEDCEIVEVSDSLGLLAESSRVMDDDDQEEEQDDEGDGEDDDDSDADDDNSNQTRVEHSEDSNAQNSEVESKEAKDDDTPASSDKEVSGDGISFADVIPDRVNLNIGEIVIDETPVEVMNQVEETDINAEEEIVNDEENIENIEQDTIEDAVEIEENIDIPMDIETVKLSDTSDTEMDTQKDEAGGMEKNDTTAADGVALEKINKKVKKMTNANVLDCVSLEGSSDEEVLEVCKPDYESTTVKMPADIDVISSSAGATSEILRKESKTVISVPKPPPLKPARINTSEVSIKTTRCNKETNTALKLKDESLDPVVSLDSDEEERDKLNETVSEDVVLEEEKVVSIRCVNKNCAQNPAVQYSLADSRVTAFFDGDKKKRSYVCEDCYKIVHQKNKELITGILHFKPLMDFELGNYHEELVEISDSESEEETEPVIGGTDLLGETTAKFLEENLVDILNDVWVKYKMDDRLEDTKTQLQKDLERLQKESLEIDELFKQCQKANDKLRNELYATFETEIHELPALTILDCNENMQVMQENNAKIPENKTTGDAVELPEPRQSKRRSAAALEPPAKKPAIPMGYAPITSGTEVPADAKEDDKDISVVKLSLEAAPPDLPPPGPLARAPLRVGMQVYAKKKASWLRATITEINPPKMISEQFTTCRVRFEHKNLKDASSTVSGRHLAYSHPADTRMIIGTRVIALFKDIGVKEYYSAGIVAEIPNPVNNYRYLIFFDDGYAQYAAHRETRVVCQSSPLVWEEVHVDSRQFVKDYITSYPERPMVRLHAGQNLKTEYRGKWLSCVVEEVDASLVRVLFADRRREWIYRGSTRLAPLFLELQAAERSRPRATPRAMPRPLTNKSNMPYVEYTRSSEQSKNAEVRTQNAEEIRRQRSVAKKSTAASQPPQTASTNLDHVTSRVVFYTPKNAVKPYKMVTHKCGPQCKRTDVLQLKDLRTYNPLAKPLLSGWERQVVRWRGNKEVMYVGGCGRRLRNMAELHRYLRVTQSDMSVDLFDFSPQTHCLAEFVLNRCIVSKKDLSNGKENVPVPCVNYYDHSLPEFYSYNTERTPTAGVPLNLDPDFLCGCDCEDDCKDKSKCACWQLTLEGARTIHMEGDVGYVYKRLPKPVPSGIYECNSRCKCKHTCLNRVAQHPLQLKLQVFKTLNKGWGIRALNDVPEGSFLCVYAGNLLTDATATLDGLNEGDEFLAELDYIEVVEQMKEGYEEDIPEDAKDLDKDELSQSSSEEDSTEEEKESKEEDDDFQPGYIERGPTSFTKRLRKRDKNKKLDKEGANNDKKGNDKNQKNKAEKKDDDCITISDDESREPSCFTAAAGMRANEFVSKYKSVRTLYGEDEACYIMDAKVKGNIGRYLNHSCSPNVFVQNVFVDTHDPRFPWVAFFALSHVRAGTELTWNYNYDVGSVPGKVLYCLCGAPNCKGRLL